MSEYSEEIGTWELNEEQTKEVIELLLKHLNLRINKTTHYDHGDEPVEHLDLVRHGESWYK